MFVIAVEEGVLLAPVGLHVGGVDIEGDARGRRVAGVEEQRDEQVGEALEIGDHLVIAAVAGFPRIVPAGSALTCRPAEPGSRDLRFAVRPAISGPGRNGAMEWTPHLTAS